MEAISLGHGNIYEGFYYWMTVLSNTQQWLLQNKLGYYNAHGSVVALV
jgi:hypothetical protein